MLAKILDRFTRNPPLPPSLYSLLSCTIVILHSYSLNTQVMLILILINVQYLQNIFSFEKGWSGQNHCLSYSHHPIDKSPQANFTPPPLPLPLNTYWKTLGKGPSLLKFVCLFQVKFSFSIDNIFFQSSIKT